MKKTICLLIASLTALCCLVGCSSGDKYKHEKFFGTVRSLDLDGRLVIYIPGIGDVEIPECDSICSCFDGHEANDPKNYKLKAGDLVAVNFRYERHYDDHGVAIMESYPARFDREAWSIEALEEYVFFDKVDGGYVLSFAETEETRDASLGDTVYFFLHGGENGVAYRKLYAEGEVTERAGDMITVFLKFHESEVDFLKYYTSMSISLTSEF